MPKIVAIEMMDFNPFLGPLLDGDDPRPSENKRLKECCELYLSIGFYRDLDQPEGSQIRYYLFEDRHRSVDEIKTYLSLVELEQALQSDSDRKDIFWRKPKVFIEGHGDDDRYGIGGDHPRREAYRHYLEHPDIPTDASEQIHDANFDKIIDDLRDVIRPNPRELFITLEVCNADNIYLGKSLWGHDKTFLARLSESHKDITFSGTGPWDSSHVDSAISTGNCAPGGVNTPIMSMGGNIWKPGNTVAFYHTFTINGLDPEQQVLVKKSKFSSTQTAKALKVNTVNYAAKHLETTKLSFEAKQSLLQKISSSRDILKVDDLKLIPDFPAERYETKETLALLMKENQILASEKYEYIELVHRILSKGNRADHRDILKIALGLKDFTENGCVIEGSVFEGHAKLLDDLLADKRLLELVMVTCGKVLIAGPSNDSLIDLLMLRGISVNSVDEHGMTATHYALQNFYVYRKEPLDLVKKLLACGADLELADQKGETPYRIAIRHGSKDIVHGGQTLVELIKTRVSSSASRSETRSLLTTNLGFFKKLENEFLEEHRHDDPGLQHEYDKRFGLVLQK